MVNNINIGILGIQGAISEHNTIIQKTLNSSNKVGKISIITKPKDLEKINALVIPGGESTVISKFLTKTKLNSAIKKKVNKEKIAVMGTCAGAVIISSKISNQIKNEIELLDLINIEVERNAFGRQKESFEKKIKIKNFNSPFNAVFIRAPAITKVGDNIDIYAKINKKIVMARKDNILAVSFHPELTNDLRVHKLFLDMI